MDTNHVFPHSELAVILIVGVIGFIVSGAHIRCWVGLALWSEALLGVEFAPKFLQ